MTRLTADMVCRIREGLTETDRNLVGAIGLDLRGLACRAANLDSKFDLTSISAAVIPVTCGKGITPGFTASVKEILSHLGMSAEVTSATDVAGFSEAVRDGYDLAFMADDEMFIAHSIGTSAVVENSECTALGFVQAMEEAAHGLQGKKVTVIGLGKVGSHAIHHLQARGAAVTGLDVDHEAIVRASTRFGIGCLDIGCVSLGEAELIFQACPGRLDDRLVKKGSVVVAPGVPFIFEDGDKARSCTVIHDMLPTGVAVMAAKAVKNMNRELALHGVSEWRLTVND